MRSGPASPASNEPHSREPEHQDDTPLRPIENSVETTGDDEIVDDDVDFSDQPVTTDANDVVEGDTDAAYFPPTDPVIRAGTGREPEVAGGFSASAEPATPERSSDGRIGDEGLADAVRDALALDASTADLRLTVDVRDAVVRVRGTVAGLEDSENAEAVASAVPGVSEVIDETEVAS